MPSAKRKSSGCYSQKYVYIHHLIRGIYLLITAKLYETEVIICLANSSCCFIVWLGVVRVEYNFSAKSQFVSCASNLDHRQKIHNLVRTQTHCNMEEHAIVVSTNGEAMEATGAGSPARRICTLDEAIEATGNSNNEMPYLFVYCEQLLSTFPVHPRNRTPFLILIAVGKYQVMLICLAGLSHMGGLLESANIPCVAPYARCELGFSTVEQGVLLSATVFGMVFTLHFWGFIADSYGRQKALCASTIGGISMSLVAAFSYDIYSLIVLRFLTGAL